MFVTCTDSVQQFNHLFDQDGKKLNNTKKTYSVLHCTNKNQGDNLQRRHVNTIQQVLFASRSCEHTKTVIYEARIL